MKRPPPQGCREADLLAGQLRKRSRKVTGPRRAILELLALQKHPLSIREIHNLLHDRSCDLATVYRSMNLLDRLGMVKRFDFGDGSGRYELNRHSDGGHHHHLVCTNCAKVVEIEECFPRELEQKIANGNGFARITHKLEFFGICPKCQIE